MLNKGRFIFYAIFMGIFVIKCAPSVAKRPGEREFVERNKERPKWVITPPKEDKEKIWNVGTRTKAVMLENGITDARMDGIGKIADAVKIEFRREYERARVEKGLPENDADIGWVVNDGIMAISQVVVSGVREVDFYWEKYKVYNADGSVSYFYDVWVLVEIPKTEFKKALNEVFERLKRKARENLNQKAEELIERMREGFKRRGSE